MWWPGKSRREERQRDSGGDLSRSDPEPGPTPNTSGADWRRLPPLQRVTEDPPSVTRLGSFGATLRTHQDPRFLEPLGHYVEASAPAGRVDALVRPAASVQRSFPGPAAALTAASIAPGESEPARQAEPQQVPGPAAAQPTPEQPETGAAAVEIRFEASESAPGRPTAQRAPAPDAARTAAVAPATHPGPAPVDPVARPSLPPVQRRAVPGPVGGVVRGELPVVPIRPVPSAALPSAVIPSAALPPAVAEVVQRSLEPDAAAGPTVGLVSDAAPLATARPASDANSETHPDASPPTVGDAPDAPPRPAVSTAGGAVVGLGGTPSGWPRVSLQAVQADPVQAVQTDPGRVPPAHPAVSPRPGASVQRQAEGPLRSPVEAVSRELPGPVPVVPTVPPAPPTQAPRTTGLQRSTQEGPGTLPAPRLLWPPPVEPAGPALQAVAPGPSTRVVVARAEAPRSDAAAVPAVPPVPPVPTAVVRPTWPTPPTSPTVQTFRADAHPPIPGFVASPDPAPAAAPVSAPAPAAASPVGLSRIQRLTASAVRPGSRATAGTAAMAPVQRAVLQAPPPPWGPVGSEPVTRASLPPSLAARAVPPLSVPTVSVPPLLAPPLWQPPAPVQRHPVTGAGTAPSARTAPSTAYAGAPLGRRPGHGPDPRPDNPLTRDQQVLQRVRSGSLPAAPTAPTAPAADFAGGGVIVQQWPSRPVLQRAPDETAPDTAVAPAPETPAPASAPAAPTAATAAAASAGAAGAAAPNLDELARRLYEPLSARLRAELWLDRERSGRSMTR